MIHHAHAGRTPQSKPPALRPGQRYHQVRHRRAESSDEAIARCRGYAWWPRVVEERPRLCGPWWVWIVEEVRP